MSRTTEAEPDSRKRAGRLAGLDAFRGITVAAMVLVNNPGDVQHTYPALTHAVWDGWGLAELIAPAFLWVVGVAIVLSMVRRRERGATDSALVGRIIRRFVVLMACGIALSAIPDLFPRFDPGALETLRLPGTLQRIAICYLAAALLVLRLGIRGQALLAAGLIGGYWILMLLVPVPGYGVGILAPEGNVAQYVDHLILGRHAKWSDPLGLLSTLPAIGTTLLGTIAGMMIRPAAGPAGVARTLAASGAAAAVAGALLSIWIPVNEGLWSPSFAVLMPGIASLLCAAAVWMTDVRGLRRWSRPLEIYGFNALVVFIGSQAFASLITAFGFATPERAYISLKGYLVDRVFMPLGSPGFASLCYAAVVTAGFYGLTYVLYRRRWFLTV